MWAGDLISTSKILIDGYGSINGIGTGHVWPL
jgi:hypothetical protein